MPVIFICDHCKRESEGKLVNNHMQRPTGYYVRQDLDKISVACSKICANTIDRTRPKIDVPIMGKIFHGS